MGSITYDFLADSILLNPKEIASNYASLTDSQLEAVLQAYREHCLTNLSELERDVKGKESALKVMSTIDLIPFENIKQSALYFDQFIISDPLFRLTSKAPEGSDVFGAYLGFAQKGVGRREIASSASMLRELTPMVAGDFLKILPLSKPFEPPKYLPIDFPDKGYGEGVPPQLLAYCRERILLSSMMKAEEGWQILEEHDFTPGILLDFEDCDGRFSKHFHYMYKHILAVDKSTRKVQTVTKLADYPMDKKEWTNWVKQSIDKTAVDAIERVLVENVVASAFGATYVTDNAFVANLLKENFGENDSIAKSSATQFMNINLPFLDRVDISKLMQIRTFEQDTFTNFRIELERNFRELRMSKDPYEIKLIQENILHELAVVQVNKIDEKFRSLKRKGMFDAAILVAGLATSVQTAGWSLLASASAMVHGGRVIADLKSEMRENPSYLLWKVLKTK